MKSSAAGPNKGRVYQQESRDFRDPKTGVRVRQVTSAPAIHHHPFFYIPAFDDEMRWLVFVSHRTGTPQLFVEERSSGRLIQLTDRPDLNEWSVHPSHDGKHIYFTAGSGAWRVNTDNGIEECLADFGDVPMIPPGMVGDAMGTTTVSHDDRWWAVPVKVGRDARLHIIDTATGDCNAIIERDSIGHPEFHPKDSRLLHYAGPYHQRLWTIRRDGTNHYEVLARNAQQKQWFVHEIWNPLDAELLVVDWPHGMFGVQIETKQIRPICQMNAWHASISRDGRRMVCDTTYPDRGLWLWDSRTVDVAPVFLCDSASSNSGEHWNKDHCPYDDGPVKVYAPQHTHPHPTFSPDGKQIVFTSDRTGVAQIYEVTTGAY